MSSSFITKNESDVYDNQQFQPATQQRMIQMILLSTGLRWKKANGCQNTDRWKREWCKTALFRNHSPEQYSFIMETFTCEIELFSFNDPPIVWFFWSVYKARNNHTWSLLLTAQHNKSRESRLIRKPSVTQVVERYFHRMHCESWWNFLSKGRRGVEEIWNCRRSWSILMRLFLTFFLFSFLCRSRGQLCLHIMSL